MKTIIAVTLTLLTSLSLTPRVLADGGTSSEGGGGTGCRILTSVHGTPSQIGYVVIRTDYQSNEKSVALYNSKAEAYAHATPLSTQACTRINPENQYDLGVTCNGGTVTVDGETLGYDFEARYMAGTAYVAAMDLYQGQATWASLILSCQDHIGPNQ